MNDGDVKMVTNLDTHNARDAIMRSIRSHLAASEAHELQHFDQSASVPLWLQTVPASASLDLVQLFKRNLEAVDGQCIVVNSETEVEETAKRITAGKLTATSDAPPATRDLFKYDVGITRVQAGIAETGTLVLDSSVERNRLVSLVPPVHIAVLNASHLYRTLGETLAALQRSGEVSSAITFITGPSRTADIELTLAIGVHGPQELYVIVNRNS